MTSILPVATLPLHTKATLPTMQLPINRQFGTLKTYNSDKGFGLITSDFGGELIVRSKSTDDVLKEGMRVSYEAVAGPRLLIAEEVRAE